MALLAAAMPALARPADLETLRVGAGTTTTTVARLNGLFQKYGIDIQKVPSVASETMRRYLAEGTVDIVDDGLDNAVASVIGGVDIVIVTGSALLQQELIAQPENKSARDLRGKTLIVDALNTQNALVLKKILRAEGLQPDRDYQLKSVSIRRLPELQAHKEYAAAMLSGATALFARRQGFVSLGSSSNLDGPLLGSGSYVRRQWARDHADLLARYIAANIEAQRWILDPANQARMIEIIMATSEPRVAADIANEVYADLTRGPGALTKDLRFDAPAFENFLKLRAEIEGSWGGVPPAAAGFYDLSYYDAALARLRKQE